MTFTYRNTKGSKLTAEEIDANFLEIESLHDDKADKLILETAQKTTDYTLALTDKDKVVAMNKTGAATLTVPTNASVPFTIGTVVGGYNASADAVTVVGAATVTVRNAGAFAQYSEWCLRKRGTNEWVLVGATI